MTAIKIAIMALSVGLLLLGGIASSATWNDEEIWNAIAQGGHDLALSSDMKNTMTIDDSGSISKNVLTSLNAIGANQVQLQSVSILTETDGSHVSTIRESATQTYTLPQASSLALSNLQTITGFPNDPVSSQSTYAGLLDTNGNIVGSISSSSENSDVDTIINNALADQGLQNTLADFEGLAGSIQYSIDRTDTNKGITAAWGETRNEPVKMSPPGRD